MFSEVVLSFLRVSCLFAIHIINSACPCLRTIHMFLFRNKASHWLEFDLEYTNDIEYQYTCSYYYNELDCYGVLLKEEFDSSPP